MRRYEWATVPKVLTPELLSQVANIAGGYTVTQGYGGWLADNGELYQEAQATLRVDGLNPGHAAIIDGLILREARRAGELAVWKTMTELAETRLLETSEVQNEQE